MKRQKVLIDAKFNEKVKEEEERFRSWESRVRSRLSLDARRVLTTRA